MKPYAPTFIQVAPNRQRQVFDPVAMEELRSSIDGKQLQNAPVVRESADGPVLVSGERRLRVIQDIFALGGHFWYDGIKYVDQVPTVTLGELSLLDAEEAELDENLKRKDLTWQEHAAAVKRLHELRQAQREITRETAAACQDETIPTAHTVADTTRELYPHLADVAGNELGTRAANVRKEIIVAKNMHVPGVSGAKTLDEAFKVLKRSEQTAENVALAEKIGATFTASLHQVYNKNCLEWMQGCPERFQVILTDPPYGMGADAFGDGAGKLTGIEHRYDDSHEAWTKLMTQWCPLSYQLAAAEAHAYVFCDIDRFHELKDLMQLAGWYVFRTPLIDRKINSGRVPLPDRGPRRTYELILYAIKGNMPVTHIYDDVIDCKADENMTHGAQKPVSLFQNLLMRSVKPGYRVLDTFGGSGTTITACHAMKCVATVIEQEPEYYGMCLGRLQALKNIEDPLNELKGME